MQNDARDTKAIQHSLWIEQMFRDYPMRGGGENDTLLGDFSNNFFIGSAGNDRIDGGLGTDTIDYSQADLSGVQINLRDAAYDGVAAHSAIKSTGGMDTLLSIEHVIGSSGNDRMIGSVDDNVLEGGAGHDNLLGAEGNDTLFGGDGNDFLDGGSQNDVLDGGAGDDVLVGAMDHSQSVLLGGDGNDSALIRALYSRDTMNGGAGVDTLDYSYLRYANAPGYSVRVDLEHDVALKYASPGVLHVSRDTISQFENVIGSDGDDEIIGNAGNNRLAGGRGRDVLRGGAGADTYVFGRGDGFDEIQNTDNDAPGSHRDVLEFGPGIRAEDLRFSRLVDNSLRIQVAGTDDWVKVTGYFNPKVVNAKLDEIRFVDQPSTVLGMAQLDRLVQALAGIAPQGAMLTTGGEVLPMASQPQGFSGWKI